MWHNSNFNEVQYDGLVWLSQEGGAKDTTTVQHNVEVEPMKRCKNNENMHMGCMLVLIYESIYTGGVSTKPLATSEGFTSLLRHSQEKNQAAEEEQGPHDQS